jgi:hypothetical protein
MSQNWMDHIRATGIGQRRTTEPILTLRRLYRKEVKKTKPEMSVFKGLRKN